MERSLPQALTIAHGEIQGLWDSAPSATMLLAAAVAVAVPGLARLVAIGRRVAGPGSR